MKSYGNRGYQRKRGVWTGVRTGFAALIFTTVAGIVAITAASAHGAAGGDTPAGMPAAKASRLQQQVDQMRADTKGHQKPSVQEGAQNAAKAPHVVEPRTAGINNDMHQGPFPAVSFQVRNFYQGAVGTQWYLVYAGATGAAEGGTAAGGVRIISESAQNALSEVGTFTDPGAGGPLHIVAADGANLSLADDQGKTVTFNLVTLQFG